MKTTTNSTTTLNLSNVSDSANPLIAAPLVKTINSFEDDFLTGRTTGRTTGFCGGYSSNLNSSSRTSVMPLYSGFAGFTPLPPASGTGSADIKIASSSTQDSATGTGVFGMIIFYMDMNLNVNTEIAFLNGTTPVTLTMKNVYHFMNAFPIVAGSTVPVSDVNSNKGIIWLGVGTTFSGSTGFNTTNYMWNRIGDGFISSAHYVVPRGKYASLWTVKFNADRNVNVNFQTYVRQSRTGIWSLNSEDFVGTGLLIQRTFAGGFLPAGAEMTCTAQPVSGVNINANFVLTAREISARIYSQGDATF